MKPQRNTHTLSHVTTSNIPHGTGWQDDIYLGIFFWLDRTTKRKKNIDYKAFSFCFSECKYIITKHLKLENYGMECGLGCRERTWRMILQQPFDTDCSGVDVIHVNVLG